MKDLLSTFHNEVFRPIITLFVPGAIAVSTWFIAIMQTFPDLAKTANHNHIETTAVLVIAILFTSMLLEDWGSWIESGILDKAQNRKTKGQFERDWKRYLLLAYKTDPVARRYLRTLLQRLKFELDSSVGLFVAGVGLYFVALPSSWSWFVNVAPFLAALYLLGVEGRATHRLMGTIRHDLLDGPVVLLGQDDVAPKSSAAAAVGT